MLRALARLYLSFVLIGAPLACALALAWSSFGWWLVAALLSVQLLPVLVVLVLRWFNPPTTAFMRRAAAALRRQGSGEAPQQRWVPESGLPAHLRLAAIAGEDVYFALHEGFDWGSLRAAYAHNRADGGLRGGSTISQQVAKNLFLSPAHSYVRKAVEAYLTLLIEAAWSKRRILEVYLNIAQFGPGTFGAEAAARRFFGKSAWQLTPQQSALLVAVLPKPRTYRADQPTHSLRFRQVMILTTMKKLGDDYLARLSARNGRLHR